MKPPITPHVSSRQTASTLLVLVVASLASCADPPKQVEVDVEAGKYAVREGDSLTLIAKREYGDGSLWYVLLNANPDLRFRPNFILSPGEVINLPAEDNLDKSMPKSVFPEKLPASYVVLPGDSLHFIALQCYGDRDLWETIYEANKSTLSEAVKEDPRRLTAGQVLLIPEKIATN